MSRLERYRENLASKMTAIWTWLQEMLLFVIAPSNRITWRDVWNQLLLRLCVVKSRIKVDSKEKKRLLDWVATKIHHGKPPTDFNESWKNGISLCALVEGIVKGSCPRYDLLNPKHAISNFKLALHLIEKNVRIKPGITVEEFSHYDAVTERKLVCLVSQLKLASAKLRLKSAIQRPVISLNRVTTIGAEGECIAKGMGLMLAVKGRKARFHLYLKSLTIMNIVVEIRGPENTICSERITNRSPRRRSLSKLDENHEWKKIPLDYNIQPGKITVGYTPIVIGNHRLSIIWQGQHIIGSPYTISVDDAARTVAAEPKEIKRLIVPLKRADNLDYGKKENARCRKLNTVSFGDVRKLGNVSRKRILRRYLIVDGKEVVIENNDLETLAKAVTNLRVKSKSSSSNCDVSELSTKNDNLLVDNKSSGNDLNNRDNQNESISSNSHLRATEETVGGLESINDKSACNLDKPGISKIHVPDEESTHNMTINNENLQQSNNCTISSKNDNLCHTSINLHSKQKENKENSPKPHISSSPTRPESNSVSLYNTTKRALHDIKEMSSENSSDFFQQSNLPASKATMKQEGECNKINHVECAHFQHDCTDSAIRTIESSPRLDVQLRNSPEMLVETDFKSRVDNTDDTKALLTDCDNYARSDSLPLDNARIQSPDGFNQNAIKIQNDKGDSHRSSVDLEKSNDDQSLQSSQAPIHLNNIQQNTPSVAIVQGITETTSIIPEKISSQTFDQICFPESEVPKSHLTTNNDDIIKYISQEKPCTEYISKHCQENNTMSKQFNISIDRVEYLRREESGVARNYDNKNYPVEKLLKGNCINKVEETSMIRENNAQTFQSDLTIRLNDDETVSSRIADKENIGSEHKSQSKQNDEEISSMEEQEEETVFRTHSDNNVREYTSGRKRPIIEGDDWIDHRREGFLLGLMDENFKIVESPNTEESKSSKIHYRAAEDATVNNESTLMPNNTCITRKFSDSAISDVSKNFGKFTLLEYHGGPSASIDETSISKSAPSVKQFNHAGDTLCTSQWNLNFLHGDIKTDISSLRHSPEPTSSSEQNLCVVDFEQGNSPTTESNFINLSRSESPQSIVQPSSFLGTINQNPDLANKTPNKAVFNNEQNTMGARHPFENQGNNSKNKNVQSESLTKLQNSELSENLYSQHETIKELHILKESEESLKSPQRKLCCSPQKPQCLSSSSNSNSLESPPLVIQHSYSSINQQNSDELENTCFSDDEEFPFSAIVQEKKVYWEKKLEEKAPRQIQKVCSFRKDCNNVDKLKTFWQHVATDSMQSERTKVHTHRSISN